MRVDEVTYYLEMRAPGELRPARPPAVEVALERARIPCPELNRFLYCAVGGEWYWVDRLSWSYARWREYLSRPDVETWVAAVSGTPAGYFELRGMPEVEIASFGLLPCFTGQGIGGHLLTAAVRRAWEKGAGRVWLHTSSLDHPHARANYLARGFRLYHEETAPKELPEEPPGPWPGAGRCR